VDADVKIAPKPMRKSFRYEIAIPLIMFAFVLVVFFLSNPVLYDEGDRKDDTAMESMKVLEHACRNYMGKNDGVPPASLQSLIEPPDGSRPYIEGGESALIDPWGQPYQYDAGHKNAKGELDPLVFTTDPANNKTLFSFTRQIIHDR
jgi:hypothetical protein